MPLIDLNALDNCELQTDPFDHIVVPDFLPPEALKRINVDYPAIDTATNHELHDLKYGPLFTNFLFELQTDEFRAHLGDKFGVDLSNCPTTITVRKYCERSDGHIHTDIGPGGLHRRGETTGWSPAGLPAHRLVLARAQAVRRRATHVAVQLPVRQQTGTTQPEGQPDRHTLQQACAGNTLNPGAVCQIVP